MENASVALGLIAILSAMFVYPTFICGSLAILFAMLSKGGERSITARARTGMIFGIIAIIITICLIFMVARLLIAMYGSLDMIPADAQGNMDTGRLLLDMTNYLNSF
jgi:hypothetical protein